MGDVIFRPVGDKVYMDLVVGSGRTKRKLVTLEAPANSQDAQTEVLGEALTIIRARHKDLWKSNDIRRK